MKDWKTTLSGVAAILIAVGTFVKVLVDGDPTTVPDVGLTLGAVSAGIGLIMARDAKKSENPTVPGAKQ